MQVTAAKLAINASEQDDPPRYAVLSTTRNWADDSTLRNGWKDVARQARKIAPGAGYCWFREWTTGKHDGVRRTHYHSVWNGLRDDDQAAELARISLAVWDRLTGAYSEKAHGWQRVWDAGGLARYVAGLVGHHLKADQAPPPGWAGRRYGTSRGWYARDSRELDKDAKAAVRDDRLRWHLERAMADSLPDRLPDSIWDELLTERIEQARKLPPPRIVVLR